MHYLSGFSANYNNDVWTIKDRLDYLSLCSLEGTLSEVMISLEKKFMDLKEVYLNGPVAIRSNNYVPSLYLANHNVIYNEIIIVVRPDHDGLDQLEIWGVRSPTETELEWLEADRNLNLLALKRKRKEEFEKLKKEFENE